MGVVGAVGGGDAGVVGVFFVWQVVLIRAWGMSLCV